MSRLAVATKVTLAPRQHALTASRVRAAVHQTASASQAPLDRTSAGLLPRHSTADVASTLFQRSAAATKLELRKSFPATRNEAHDVSWLDMTSIADAADVT